MREWFERLVSRLVDWLLRVPMPGNDIPNLPPTSLQFEQTTLPARKRSKSAAQLKREAQKRRNIEKRKQHGTRNKQSNFDW